MCVSAAPPMQSLWLPHGFLVQGRCGPDGNLSWAPVKAVFSELMGRHT